MHTHTHTYIHICTQTFNHNEIIYTRTQAETCILMHTNTTPNTIENKLLYHHDKYRNSNELPLNILTKKQYQICTVPGNILGKIHGIHDPYLTISSESLKLGTIKHIL